MSRTWNVDRIDLSGACAPGILWSGPIVLLVFSKSEARLHVLEPDKHVSESFGGVLRRRGSDIVFLRASELLEDIMCKQHHLMPLVCPPHAFHTSFVDTNVIVNNDFVQNFL